ncbi:MAG: sigma-70 family RNA polymerase sigma factor [Planctomycetota bacterium]
MAHDETPTTDALRQWHGGAESGLESLLRRHLAWLQSHVRDRLGPALRQRAETDDFVQDAFVQFLRYGPHIQVSDDRHFRALMCRIIENALRDRHDWFKARRRAASKERPLPPSTVLVLDPPQKRADSPSQMAIKHEREAWVRLGLELIDPTEREIVISRDWDGCTFEEIAGRLGISYDAARRKYTTALDHLAETVWMLRSGSFPEADRRTGHEERQR